MKTTQVILDQMMLVVLNISIWQGRKALKSTDLALNGIDVSKLPPGTLATLGSKRIISPDAVKPFIALKRAAMRICLQQGVRFGGDGYAVPKEKVAVLSSELKRLKEEFESAKSLFLSVYAEEVESWIAANPAEWTPVIRASVDSPRHIQKTLSFNYSALEVSAPSSVAENGLFEEVDSLYGQLCHEVRVAARHAYESSFVGKQEISQKTLRPIRSIRDKLAGLLFLSPAIAETIQSIDETLNKLPDGSISGTDLNMVAGLVGRQLANLGRVTEPEPEQEETVDDEPEYLMPPVVAEQSGAVEPISWDF